MQGMKTLGDALPEQITRVQELIELYKRTPHGEYAAELMQADVDAAQKAMLEGDIAKMVAAYKALLEWED